MKASTFLKEQADILNGKITIPQEQNNLLQYRLMYVNPAIIKVIGTIVVEFMKNSAAKKKDQYIKDIKEELDYIVSLLQDVIKQLKELEIFIDEKFREFIVIQLNSTIETITDNIDGWNNDINSTDEAIRLRTELQISNTFSELQQNARAAFKYGYCHYDSIGFAFSLEIFLSEILKKDKNSIKNYCQRYLTYFDLATNGAVNGSIQFVKDKITTEINSLTSAYVPKTVQSGSHYHHLGKAHPLGPETVYYKTFLIINGNINDGFTFSVYTKDDYTTENYDNTQAIQTGYINAYNRHKDLKEKLKKTDDAISVINNYVEIIRGIIDEGE